MSIAASIYLIFTKLITVNCAPKLGHVLFDPLAFEAHEVGVESPTKPKELEINLQLTTSQDMSINSEEFLENKASSDEAKLKSVKITSPTTEKEEITPITRMHKILDLYPKDISEFFNESSPGPYNVYFLRTNNDGEVPPPKSVDGYDYDVKVCKLVGNRILCGYNKNKGVIKSSKEMFEVGNGCRIRGDRIECGYDKTQKNSQKIQRENESKEINLDLRIRKSGPYDLTEDKHEALIKRTAQNNTNNTGNKDYVNTTVKLENETTEETTQNKLEQIIYSTPKIPFKEVIQETVVTKNAKTEQDSHTESPPTVAKAHKDGVNLGNIERNKRLTTKPCFSCKANVLRQGGGVTRCVEINDRIVCYIDKTTTPLRKL